MKITGIPPLKKSPRLPEWMDRRTLILLIIATIFLITLAFSEPLQQPRSRYSSAITSTAIASDTESTSGMPPEWENNSEQTDGILLGGVILVLIIVIGSYGVMRRKPHIPNQ